MSSDMRDVNKHPYLAELLIPGFYSGKSNHLIHWRQVIAEMVGGTITFDGVSRPFLPRMADNAAQPETLHFIEASAETDDGFEITPAMRIGLWDKTPEEPLLVLLLMTLPGGQFHPKHAAAIRDRLIDLDEIVHAADLGSSTAIHGSAIDFFGKLAVSSDIVTIEGCFDPVGWWSVDLHAIYQMAQTR